eukprot:scaffold114577_cov33-Prasinocladus_malaysianus.AAC.1
MAHILYIRSECGGSANKKLFGQSALTSLRCLPECCVQFACGHCRALQETSAFVEFAANGERAADPAQSEHVCVGPFPVNGRALAEVVQCIGSLLPKIAEIVAIYGIVTDRADKAYLGHLSLDWMSDVPMP